MMGELRDVPVENRGPLRVFLQEIQHFLRKIGVSITLRFQEGLLLHRRQIGGFMEKGLDSLPAKAVHLNSPMAGEREAEKLLSGFAQLVRQPGFGGAPIS